MWSVEMENSLGTTVVIHEEKKVVVVEKLVRCGQFLVMF